MDIAGTVSLSIRADRDPVRIYGHDKWVLSAQECFALDRVPVGVAND